MIPETLKQRGIRFVLLEKSGKKPFQQGWQNKNIEFDDKELISHINAGGNYGVMGGGLNQLIIIDFDNERVQEQICKKLPPTFTVKTGTGKLHKYFVSDKCNSFKIFDEEMNTLTDVQGEGKQVVGAGSIHPNGNKYEVVDESEISFLPYAEIKALLFSYDKKPKKVVEEKKEYTPKIDMEENFVEECKSQINISDVLNLIGVDTSKNPTECPFHSSKGGKCLGFQNDVAHCFHCDESWNIFSLIKQWKNCDFKEALEILADKFGMTDKLEQAKKRYVKKLREEDAKELQKVISNYMGMKDLAKQILEIQPLYYDSSKLWWIWNKDKFKWEIIDETDVLIMVDNVALINTVKTKERVEILEALKQGARGNKPKPIKKKWIQFKDLIVDYETGEEFNATPEYFVTNPIPYALHKERYIDTPTIDRIFEEWVGEEYVKTLYEIIAYCLIPDYPIHRLFCFIGSGLNGKGCFLRLLKKFIGEDNVTSTELDTLLTSRFEVTRLHKKLVCMMGETNFNELNKTSIIKKLTGQDTIGFEYKNKNPFTDDNYAKILIATNNLPTTSDKSIGFYRRWLIIDFPNQFSEKKNILEDIPEEEYEILTVKSLMILKDLMTDREFHKEGSIEERMERYEAKSNFLDKFIQLFIDEDVDGYITKADFIKKFSAWSKENKHREMSETSVGLEMKRKGYETSKKYFNWMYDGKGGQARVWLGLRWKE